MTDKGQIRQPQSNRSDSHRLESGPDQPSHASAPVTDRPERHPIRAMQRQVGNARVARFVASRQTEQGAALDSAPVLWPQPEVGAAGGTVSNRLASRIYGSLGRGRPLSEGDRTRWEQAYGVPLDSVRIHDDAEADALSYSVSASAFTLGNDIFMGRQAGVSDQHLLGHELAHVVQQRSAPTNSALVVGGANDALEQDADAAAGAVRGVQPDLGEATEPQGKA